MDIDFALRNRRSIRQFKNTSISRETIMKIIEAGTLAPSASNKQHWRFIVITDKNLIADLCNKAGAQVIVKNAPVVIAVLYSKYESPENNANIQSVSAAVQNILLKSYQMGLGTCWVCGFGDYKKAASLLNVPENYGLMSLILLGKPAASHPSPPPKKKLSEIVYFNRFGEASGVFPKGILTSKWSLNQLVEFKKISSMAKGLGKDYEIYNNTEVSAIKQMLNRILPKGRKLRILNFLGYDGTLLKGIFPAIRNHEIYDCELDKALVDFVQYKVPTAKYITVNADFRLNKRFDMILLPFVLEKYPILWQLPDILHKNLAAGGKAVILLKNKSSFYGLMYRALGLMGLNSIDTSFYNGPFEPVSKSKVIGILRKSGFIVKSKNLLLMPPELKDYSALANSYLIRHGSRTRYAFLIRPALGILDATARVLNPMHLPLPSSSVVIIVQKSNIDSGDISLNTKRLKRLL